MRQWIADQLRTTTLGDTRRKDRVAFMIEQFAAKPGESIPQVFGDWKDIKAAYRLLSNPLVSPAEIHAALCDSCVGRLQEQNGMVLAIQDTTSLDFSAHPHTSGLGPLGGGDGSAGHGFFLHSVLAVGADGVPLGLLHQEVWARDPADIGKHHQRHERPLEDKESSRWLRALDAVHRAVPASVEVLTVGDREADIYALLAFERPAHSHLLIRAAQDRRVDGEAGHLRAAVEAAPEAGRYELLVRQHPTHAMRNATVAVRFCEVTLLPPLTGGRRSDLPPVALTALEVREVPAAERAATPGDRAPLRWLLLTDLPVADLATARDLVGRYCQRWLIERYHYVLKSGCKIEDHQLHTAAALQRLVAIYCVVAWRLLWMTYAAREHPQEPCTVAFSDLEWQILYWRQYGRKELPDKPPDLREAVRWLAKLGGFIGRKGDGEPGVKVLWRGLMQLQENVIGYQLANPAPQDVGKA